MKNTMPGAELDDIYVSTQKDNIVFVHACFVHIVSVCILRQHTLFLTNPDFDVCGRTFGHAVLLPSVSV